MRGLQQISCSSPGQAASLSQGGGANPKSHIKTYMQIMVESQMTAKGVVTAEEYRPGEMTDGAGITCSQPHGSHSRLSMTHGSRTSVKCVTLTTLS